MSPSVERFNEAKYKALMDGLECSEISFMNAMASSYSSRLDSVFFKKDAIEFSLISKEWDVLSAICPKVKSGTTPTIRDEDLKEGVALLKTNDIRNNILNPLSTEQFFYIDEQTNKKMKSTLVKGKDVLINIVGASTDVIGRVSFVPDEFITANITQAMAILRIENNNYLPEYLFAFLLSNYAKRQTDRIARQTGQYNMNLKEVGTYRIWKPSMDFQLQIAKIINIANTYQIKAKKLYQDGQDIASRLFSISKYVYNQNISIRSMNSSYKASARLDAEYYQTKYQMYENAVFTTNKSYTYVKDKFKHIKTKCSRELDTYNYIEIGDVDVGTGTASFNAIKTKELPDNAKIMTIKGDVLVSTVRPNRGAIAILENDNLLVSGAFTVLRQKDDYPKEVLQTLFRTSIYKDWLLRFNVGTSYPVIKDDDVLNMPIPVYEKNIEDEIVSNVRNAYHLRNQSKQLIDFAKRAVEISIEQDEEKAIEWLKEKGVEC